jgi:pSer/pThr/pTyr-binding forkhead associated (FHA) protein
MPRLVFITPEFASHSCDLPEGTLTVGRSRHNHIVIEDNSVSAKHCELLVHGCQVIVRERGSHNGTFVNGIRVAAQSGVNSGQRLRLGAVEARLEVELAEDDDATPITATEDYRRLMRESARRTIEAQSFPVIISRAQSGPARSATLTFDAPPPPAAPAPEPEEETHTIHRHWTLQRKIWIAVGLIVVALLMFWMPSM